MQWQSCCHFCLFFFEYAATPAASHPQQVSTPRLAAPYPDGFSLLWARRGCCQGNLRVLLKEGIVQKKTSESKKKNLSSWIIHLSSFPLFSDISPSSSTSFSELNSHILTLSIHLYSHLFTFLFKIFVYKCVYKLKIISSFPVSKWHLQGKGCVGLRFLIALQKPTKRQHRTLSKCMWDWFYAYYGSKPKLWVMSYLWAFIFRIGKMTHDLGP